MRIQGLAGTAISVALVLSGAVRAEAEIRTDGLSGRQLKTWKAIVAVIDFVISLVLSNRIIGLPTYHYLRLLWPILGGSVGAAAAAKLFHTLLTGWPIWVSLPVAGLVMAVAYGLLEMHAGRLGRADHPLPAVGVWTLRPLPRCVRLRIWRSR